MKRMIGTKFWGEMSQWTFFIFSLRSVQVEKRVVKILVHWYFTFDRQQDSDSRRKEHQTNGDNDDVKDFSISCGVQHLC